jgi:hypothetical protein
MRASRGRVFPHLAGDLHRNPLRHGVLLPRHAVQRVNTRLHIGRVPVATAATIALSAATASAEPASPKSAASFAAASESAPSTT